MLHIRIGIHFAVNDLKYFADGLDDFYFGYRLSFRLRFGVGRRVGEGDEAFKSVDLEVLLDLSGWTGFRVQSGVWRRKDSFPEDGSEPGI
jgi:hypothetical protein